MELKALCHKRSASSPVPSDSDNETKRSRIEFKEIALTHTLQFCKPIEGPNPSFLLSNGHKIPIAETLEEALRIKHNNADYSIAQGGEPQDIQACYETVLPHPLFSKVDVTMVITLDPLSMTNSRCPITLNLLLFRLPPSASPIEYTANVDIERPDFLILTDLFKISLVTLENISLTPDAEVSPIVTFWDADSKALFRIQPRLIGEEEEFDSGSELGSSESSSEDYEPDM